MKLKNGKEEGKKMKVRNIFRLRKITFSSQMIIILQEEPVELERASSLSSAKEPIPISPVDTPAKLQEARKLATVLEAETVEETTPGKDSSKTGASGDGLHVLESSLPASTSVVISSDKKPTALTAAGAAPLSVSKLNSSIADNRTIKTGPVKDLGKGVMFSGKDQGKVSSPSTSPEQVVTVTPQFRRLIPELSPKSQRVKAGTVRAVYTAAGTTNASPQLKTAVAQLPNTSSGGDNAEVHTEDTGDAASTESTASAGAKNSFGVISGKSAVAPAKTSPSPTSTISNNTSESVPQSGYTTSKGAKLVTAVATVSPDVIAALSNAVPTTSQGQLPAQIAMLPSGIAYCFVFWC